MDVTVAGGMQPDSSRSGFRDAFPNFFELSVNPSPIIFTSTRFWTCVKALFSGGREEGRWVCRCRFSELPDAAQSFTTLMWLVCVDVSVAGLKLLGNVNDCFKFKICWGCATVDEMEIGSSWTIWRSCKVILDSKLSFDSYWWSPKETLSMSLSRSHKLLLLPLSASKASSLPIRASVDDVSPFRWGQILFRSRCFLFWL